MNEHDDIRDRGMSKKEFFAMACVMVFLCVMFVTELA